MTTLAAPRLSLGRETLLELKSVLDRHIPDQSPALQREIGFAAGQALYAAFVASVGERFGVETPQGLDVKYLGDALAGFFRDEGWGTVSVDHETPGLVALDASDWTEAEGGTAAAANCHFSAGMLSEFFTRLGGQPAAVMEVDCRARSDARCRFLIGSPDLLTWVYEGMVSGRSLEEVTDRLRRVT